MSSSSSGAGCCCKYEDATAAVEFLNNMDSPMDEKADTLKGDECKRSREEMGAPSSLESASCGKTSLLSSRGRPEKGGVGALRDDGGGNRNPRVGGVEERKAGVLVGVLPRTGLEDRTGTSGRLVVGAAL